MTTPNTAEDMIGILAGDALEHFRTAREFISQEFYAEAEAYIEAGERAFLRADQLRIVVDSSKKR